MVRIHRYLYQSLLYKAQDLAAGRGRQGDQLRHIDTPLFPRPRMAVFEGGGPRTLQMQPCEDLRTRNSTLQGKIHEGILPGFFFALPRLSMPRLLSPTLRHSVNPLVQHLVSTETCTNNQLTYQIKDKVTQLHYLKHDNSNKTQNWTFTLTAV